MLRLGITRDSDYNSRNPAPPPPAPSQTQPNPSARTRPPLGQRQRHRPARGRRAERLPALHARPAHAGHQAPPRGAAGARCERRRRGSTPRSEYGRRRPYPSRVVNVLAPSLWSFSWRSGRRCIGVRGGGCIGERGGALGRVVLPKRNEGMSPCLTAGCVWNGDALVVVPSRPGMLFLKSRRQ